jgi:hypothetical protein
MGPFGGYTRIKVGGACHNCGDLNQEFLYMWKTINTVRYVCIVALNISGAAVSQMAALDDDSLREATCLFTTPPWRCSGLVFVMG